MISLYFHTIYHLKIKQILFRLFYFFYKPNIKDFSTPKLRELNKSFCIPIKKFPSLVNNDTFLFLNQKASLSKIGWDNNFYKMPKLWRYNQHYFDNLNSIDAHMNQKWHKNILDIWVSENPLGKSIGWDPYPTSLRIVNWIKWHLIEKDLSDKCINSLALQARWLNKKIEWHILGNHLFSNAKALIFAGLFFSNKESEIWFNKGLKIVDQEVNEQVLNDGGNFERSPMYHALFLEDLLDIINLLQVYENDFSKSKINDWKNLANKMLRWLACMTHPNDEISFFNDAVNGVAPGIKSLNNYAKALGVTYKNIEFEKITHLSESGYIRYNSRNAVAILDVGQIGPRYIPSHAHADTLSFELSLFKEKFLVNVGISDYENSIYRKYERSTKAHNTVEINNKNSSEVWSNFRVGRRAYPFDLEIKEEKSFFSISCSHDGYKHLKGNPIHRRSWSFYKNSMVVTDKIYGNFRKCFAYFHFHPLVKIAKNQKGDLNIELPNGKKVLLQVKTGKAELNNSYYSPEFGKKYKTICLKILFVTKSSCIKILWNNEND